MTGLLLMSASACGKQADTDKNLVKDSNNVKRTVNMFTPMEKSNPNADNSARTAQELTVIAAEEALGIQVEYRTYTAENYQEKTYDEVLVDRARSNMDDIYLLNPDTLLLLGSEGYLADLSGLESAKNLREVVKVANTVNGKLVGIPQEVVAYGLFVNKDTFDQYNIKLPDTPEEFLECCRVLKENGIETPLGANRWWLETFVLAQGYAELYNGDNTDAEIAALNSGESKMSDYMRPGFEFLKELIDNGYINVEKAYVSEAIEAEGPDFLAGKTPIVMAYWGAAISETAYGKTDFNMQVIGFPSSMGPMPVVTLTGFGISANAENLENAMSTLDFIVSDEMLQLYTDNNHVISPSRNVNVECTDALKPLNDRINEGFYVLGSNANMKVEQWGNICLVVRQLLNGASVEECMAEFDRIQAEALAQ